MTRAAGGAFDGTASSWAETINGDDDSLVTLNGLPAGLVLSIGDYVGFKWDAEGAPPDSYYRRALVRVVVGGVASAGGSVTVTSEPPVPLVVPVGAKAHLDRPACVMTMLSADTRLEPIDRSGGIRGGNIVAVQDLRD
jgi:hypothetical protein